VVLNPVRLSVLPERDASCNTMLPAEKRYDLTFEPPRPPGPSQGRLAFAPAGLPAAPAAPRPPAEAAPVREFVVQYDFDGLVGFSHPTVLSAALEHAKQSNARSVEIVGYRGAVRLSNGQTMVEAASIGQRRAEQVAMLLRGAGLTAPSYKVGWVDAAARATGTDDHLTRRVVITVRR
jgi:outer membrane protein OmpA-like peptidoglycan-associated protein